ncbi:hypothetical protein CEXT_510241 [Caerostris extrusa]|uniref:Uncharacterized protein n=1 Tax=Caerostris extrusa TaxID=172846 RepID=A0AAV4QTG5_CAEEX|nr:hypothetical protein CEXT_510241 [Caerostris extrusa]
MQIAKPLNCAVRFSCAKMYSSEFEAQHLENARGEEKALVFKIISHKPNQLSVFDNNFSFQFSRLAIQNRVKIFFSLFPYTLPSSEGEESNVPVQVEGEISLCKLRKPLNCAVRFSYAKMYSSEFVGLLYGV